MRRGGEGEGEGRGGEGGGEGEGREGGVGVSEGAARLSVARLRGHLRLPARGCET